MNPFHLFQIYFKTLNENHSSVKLPISEKCYHFVVPFLFSIILLFYIGNSGLTSSAVNFLITVHGILISVLMASFTPFIEKLDYRAKDKTEVSKEEKEYSKSLRTAKKLVFSANSLAIFISLLVIVLLLAVDVINKSESVEKNIFNFQIKFSFCYYIFYTVLFYLITLNGILITRTVHILSDIVMARIDDGE